MQVPENRKRITDIYQYGDKLLQNNNMRAYCQYLSILLASMLVAGSSYAQEDPTGQQYLFNLLNINPAYAGSRGTLCITTGFRRQWAGIPGAPQTAVFSVDGPINEHHLGLGLQLYTNSLGLERTNGANMSFSTILNFNEDEFLSLGLQAGVMNYRIDRTSVPLPFQEDPAFQYNTNVLLPTAGAGVYYQRPGFYAGLSAPSLLVSTVKVDKIISVNSATLRNVQLLLSTGITASLSDELDFKPSILMRWMSGKVFEVHLNGSFWYKDLISLGASYRADDAILGTFECKINDRISFGYSYGKSIGEKGVFSQGTHEALIRINLRSPDE